MADATDLLLLQQKLRQCTSLVELGYSIVNESARVAKYQIAVLWVADDSKGNIQSVSGLAKPVEDIPFTRWAQDLCNQLYSEDLEGPTQLESKNYTEDQQAQWLEFFPKKVVWLPLSFQNKKIGGLLLGRDEDWTKEEFSILNYWSGAVAHAISALKYSRQKKRVVFKQFVTDKRYIWALSAALFLLAWVPVPLSVNSRAEVVPKDPDIVRSPIEGIIGEVNVHPNQGVVVGDLILSFDDSNIKAQNDFAAQELAIAEAEYQSTNQASVTDRSIASQLPVLQAVIDQKKSQLRYTQSLLERSTIYAERHGIVIIPKINELEGMPVQVGEKLFTLAEPGNVELEFWLAVGDSIPLPGSAEVTLFLNVYPDQSHSAKVLYVNYQAEVSPDGILGYRGRAELTSDDELRIGWRGTAKIYGEDVPVIYYLLRRPLSVFRQWIGF